MHILPFHQALFRRSGDMSEWTWDDSDVVFIHLHHVDYLMLDSKVLWREQSPESYGVSTPLAYRWPLITDTLIAHDIVCTAMAANASRDIVSLPLPQLS